MKTIRATVQNGYIVPMQPLDWPEGSDVTVTLNGLPEIKIGLAEDEWRTDPEGIAEWLHWYDSLEPIELTPEEEAAMAAWHQKQKECDIAKTLERLQGLFE